jgi:hypothetical protein
METMNRRPEEFDSPTNPKFLALIQAGADTEKELTEDDIKQGWQRNMGSVRYSVFGIVVNDYIQYFGSKRDESKQKISSFKSEGLAKDILKTLEGREVENLRLSIDEVNQELVIAIPGEPSIRIPEKGEASSSV